MAASYDRIGHASACFTHGSRQFGQEVPVQAHATLNEQITKDEKEDAHCQNRAHSSECQHCGIDQFAPE